MTDSPSANGSLYYDLVGRVAGVWATLDLNLDITLSMLAGLNPAEAACITAQFSSHYPKLKAIIALCELKGLEGQTLKDLKKFTGSIADLSERRNRAIHDAWIHKDAETIVGRFNLKTHEADLDGDPAEELKSLTDAISRRIVAFHKIHMAIINELQLLHPKQP